MLRIDHKRVPPYVLAMAVRCFAAHIALIAEVVVLVLPQVAPAVRVKQAALVVLVGYFAKLAALHWVLTWLVSAQIGWFRESSLPL